MTDTAAASPRMTIEQFDRVREDFGETVRSIRSECDAGEECGGGDDCSARPLFTEDEAFDIEAMLVEVVDRWPSAHLIAAANAAMLAALEAARAALDLAYRRDHPGAPQYGRALGIVEAAIAQARGGEAVQGG